MRTISRMGIGASVRPSWPVFRGAVGVGILLVVLGLAGCSDAIRDPSTSPGVSSESVSHEGSGTSKPKGKYMTPQEARDNIISFAKETAAVVDVAGWGFQRTSTSATPCDAGWMKLGYFYDAPEQPASRDRSADVRKVVEFWQSRGIQTVVDGDPDTLTVYGGPGNGLNSISFSTGPGLYSIAATTVCIPGVFDDYLDPDDAK